MGKKTAVFALNDFVYAKVKGYSPWPAKITKVIAKHKYKVYFYGTKETGNCKSEDLEPYDEKNRSKLNNEKQMKKADYKQAVDEIEAALQGNDPAVEVLNAPVIETVVADNTQEDISQNETSEIDPDESRLQIAEDAPKSTPVQQPKKRAPAVKKTPVVVAPPVMPLESESKENDETKVSRSGRKIKEKKINNDEMDPDDVFTQPRKRLKTDESILKNNGKPATPLNDSTTINDFCLSKMHVVEDPARKDFFMTQFEMIKLVQDVKLGLGLEEANVERSLESLKTLQEKVVPNVTKLMLLKYPNTIMTVKKLRNYIGNVASWNLEEAQLVEFQEKAKQIRNVADEIYNAFKKQFTDLPENASFWDYFMDEQKQFSERFQKLDVADLFEANSIEELETFLNKLTENDDAQVPQIHSVDIAQEVAN